MIDRGFGIYIHWPFCLAKCPYCDFNSHVSQNIDHTQWAQAYLEEINKINNLYNGQAPTSVYFGGGTPSTMHPYTVDQILNEIDKFWSISDAEITLEANPTSIESDKFAGFKSAGINRVSMGFQALNDQDLRSLGRTHNVKEGLQALEIARTYFERINFDLIYARQNQDLTTWQNELKHALTFAPDHLSLYQLTIETGTVFEKLHHAGKLLGLPNDETSAQMYEWTSEFMQENGYHHYEISNFARAHQESRHNLVYWRGGNYIGIGPGAHGRIEIDGDRYATEQTRNPQKWLENPRTLNKTLLSKEDILDEYIMMALRIREGASLERIEQLGGLDMTKVNSLIESQHLWRSNQYIGATNKGRMVLNAVIEKLLI